LQSGTRAGQHVGWIGVARKRRVAWVPKLVARASNRTLMIMIDMLSVVDESASVYAPKKLAT